MKEERRLLDGPSLAEIIEYYHPPPPRIAQPPCPQNEVVAWGTAVFQSVSARVYDSHRFLAAQLATDYGTNLWQIPVHERMPFPDAPLYALGCLFNIEKKFGRRADWFLWLEDDVSVPADLMRRLRKSADPNERPIMACVGFDRIPTFRPAVWELVDGKVKQWTSVPDNGVWEVFATGFTCVLMHRSIFDKMEEPYFATSSSHFKKDDPTHDVAKGHKPDAWFCERIVNRYLDGCIFAWLIVRFVVLGFYIDTIVPYGDDGFFPSFW